MYPCRLLNPASSGIVVRPVRAPWLLISIAVHSAAVTVALALGVCSEAFLRPPVARIEIRNAPPSAPAHAELQAPPVEAEHERDAQPLVDLVVLPAEAPPQEPVIHERALPAPPAAALDQVAKERLRKPAPVEEVVAPAAPPVEIAPPAPAAPAEPVFTSATCSDRGDPPVYPDKLRRLGREGAVVLCVLVLADGSVGEVSLKAPSRYAGFNRAALKAARKWRFEPATSDGVAVDSETDVEVVFRLTGR